MRLTSLTCSFPSPASHRQSCWAPRPLAWLFTYRGRSGLSQLSHATLLPVFPAPRVPPAQLFSDSSRARGRPWPSTQLAFWDRHTSHAIKLGRVVGPKQGSIRLHQVESKPRVVGGLTGLQGPPPSGRAANAAAAAGQRGGHPAGSGRLGAGRRCAEQRACAAGSPLPPLSPTTLSPCHSFLVRLAIRPHQN